LEEALNMGDKISAPVKLEIVSKEESFDILKEYQGKYNNPKVKEYFTKEPNKNLYNQLELITNSIELNKLSGLSVQGPI
jgi:predicted nucleic acid-binding protein